MPTPTKESLTARIAKLESDLALSEARRDTARRNADEAEKRATQKSETIDSLKLELFDAKTEIAHLRGYLVRVHEQDDVASDNVAVEEQPPRIIPATQLARNSAVPRIRMPHALTVSDMGGECWSAKADQPHLHFVNR
jgi:septal ring factor EnvC (AmiA/AmiB activator)